MNNTWIPCSERLPETADNVLAILEGTRQIMSYFDFDEGGQTHKVWAIVYDGLDGEGFYDDNYEPTHWMPLPEPPTK